MSKVVVKASQTILRVVLINFTILLAVLGVHEIGHVIFGMFMGCTNGKAIIFDTLSDGPYSEIVCLNKMNHDIVYLGGLIASVGFASLFLLTGNSPERNLFFVILGLSIISASFDIVEVFAMQPLFYISLISGIGFLSFGEFLITSAYMERESLFKKEDIPFGLR